LIGGSVAAFVLPPSTEQAEMMLVLALDFAVIGLLAGAVNGLLWSVAATGSWRIGAGSLMWLLLSAILATGMMMLVGAQRSELGMWGLAVLLSWLVGVTLYAVLIKVVMPSR
jgi:hypothetical protein